MLRLQFLCLIRETHMRTIIPLVAVQFFLGTALYTFTYDSSAARSLRRIVISIEDHDPLYVDTQSIRRTDSVVSLTYVLDVPILGKAGAERRFRSNQIELVVDCARKTAVIGNITAFAGVAATGNVTGRYSPTKEERVPESIDMRKGSTFGYLFRHICSEGSGATK